MLTLVRPKQYLGKSAKKQRRMPSEIYRRFTAQPAITTPWYTAKKQPENLEEFHLRNGVQPQLFEIDAQAPAYISGAKGTKIFIDPNSFADVTGKTVSGKLQLRLQEVFRKSEIVLTNRPTTSQDKLLETGGALNIQVTQDYIPVDLRKPLAVEIPVQDRVQNPIAMSAFRGRMSKRQPFATQPSFDWVPSTQSHLELQRDGSRSIFALTLRELNWINCDYFFRAKEARTMLTVQYDNVEPLREQTAFIVFHDINSVARMYSKRDNRFTMFNIPVQHRATIIVFGMGHYGGMYFGKTKIERTTNDVIRINLQAATEEDVVRRIQSAVI